MCKLRWHYCYKAIIQLSLLNNGAPLGYLSINIQDFLTQLAYHWNQSLDLKHASIALKEMGPRTFGLLMWVGRYNNFSREINEMQMSSVRCNLCLTWFWKTEFLCCIHACFYSQEKWEIYFIYLLQKEGKNKTCSYYLYDYINFLEKRILFQSRDCTSISAVSQTLPARWTFNSGLTTCAMHSKWKKWRPLGKKITEVMDMVTSHCILCSVLEALTYI